MFKIIIFCVVIAVFLSGIACLGLRVNNMLLHHKIDNLIMKEKYLKIVLTNNKYSGYLAIKSHYEKKLMAYAIKHKGDKFALALAKKEEAEVKYYKRAK